MFTRLESWQTHGRGYKFCKNFNFCLKAWIWSWTTNSGRCFQDDARSELQAVGHSFTYGCKSENRVARSALNLAIVRVTVPRITWVCVYFRLQRNIKKSYPHELRLCQTNHFYSFIKDILQQNWRFSHYNCAATKKRTVLSYTVVIVLRCQQCHPSMLQ